MHKALQIPLGRLFIYPQLTTTTLLWYYFIKYACMHTFQLFEKGGMVNRLHLAAVIHRLGGESHEDLPRGRLLAAQRSRSRTDRRHQCRDRERVVRSAGRDHPNAGLVPDRDSALLSLCGSLSHLGKRRAPLTIKAPLFI